MKSQFYFLAIVATFFSFGCTKNYTCECVEYYTGADTSWTKVKGTKELEVRKEAEAIGECDELDGIPQFYFTEEYGLNCELK